MGKLRRSLFLVLLTAFLALSSQAAWAYTPNVSGFISGNNTGPVQGFGYACMSYGALDWMWMTLSGPSGTEEFEWTGNSGCQSSTLSTGFQYDSDYFLTVFACGSDDDGPGCSSDSRSFRTPPRMPGDPDPPGGGSGQACWDGPCPFITGISPLPVHLGDSGTLTISGVNLENIKTVFFDTAPGDPWGGGPSIQASVTSASTNVVTLSFSIPYNIQIYAIRYIVLCDTANLPNCTGAFPYKDGNYPFSVSP